MSGRVVCFVLAVSACADPRPPMEVTAVEPTSWMQGQRQRLHISGSGFFSHLVTDVKESGVRLRGLSASIGGRELDEVEWIDNGELAAWTSEQIEPGVQDLEIRRSDGKRATLSAAVTVYPLESLGTQWSFEPPTALAGDVNDVAGFEDDDLTFAPELTTAYFCSTRGGTWDIWRAAFDVETMTIGTAQLVEELSTPDHDEDDCEVKGNGRMLIYASNDPNSEYMVLAVRPDLVSPFEIPIPLTGFYGDDPTISEDGLELIWDDTDVPYRATRSSVDEPFGPASVVDNVETGYNEFDYFLTRNGLHLFFVRAVSDNDLYVASRATPDPASPFDEGVPLDDVNTTSSEREPWISADGTLLFFTSNRTGEEVLYVSRRVP